MPVLEGRRAIVTGASRGIGAAIAQALHEAGATVVCLARTVTETERPGWVAYRVDLTDSEARSRILDRILADGAPDIVVNNAGAFGLADFEDQPLAGLDEMYRTNVNAPFAIAQRLLPPMRAAGRGDHVLIGSISDHRAFAGNSAYAATKFAARGLHEVLSEEYRGSGVRCSLVSPGPTDTPLWDPLDPDQRDDLPSRADMLDATDVAEAVRWIVARPRRVHVDWLRMGPV